MNRVTPVVLKLNHIDKKYLMKIFKKNNRFEIHENTRIGGIIGTCIIKISNNGISSCLCKQKFCTHLQAVLQKFNKSFSDQLYDYLQTPPISSKLSEDFSAALKTDLYQLVTQFLTETECLICHEKLIYPESHYQCQHCKIMYHTRCRHKWHGSCPNCKK